MNSSEQFPMLRSIGRALPQNYYPQEMISAALWNEWGGNDESRARFDRLHRSVGVRGRHLALPMEDYRALDSFSKMNDKWIERATDLGQQAIESALCQADLEAADIDHIFFTTVTGIASPSIDAKLINRMSMRTDIKRTPIFGLGCVGGAAGLARAADYLRAFPTHTAMLLSVELCSLTVQLQDKSIANVIASGLFADGAAAALLVGGARSDNSLPSPRVVASRSIFFPNTEEMMAWRLADSGFQIVLSAGVPDLVRNKLRQGVDSFLSSLNLSRRDIAHWVAHTGGPKVLQHRCRREISKRRQRSRQRASRNFECSFNSLRIRRAARFLIPENQPRQTAPMPTRDFQAPPAISTIAPARIAEFRARLQ